ncbi:MAG TPA: hypothetical protein VHT73_02735 [Thermodesulfobacteriota bacterium]|nr:hypothetical protein [Thermodesulfobacteriota bacterium]
MIFHRNAGSVLKKINISVSLQLYIRVHNQSIMSSLVIKKLQNVERLFSWFGAEKFISQIMVKPPLLKSFRDVKNLFSWVRPGKVLSLFPVGGILAAGIQSVFSQIGSRNFLLSYDKYGQILRSGMRDIRNRAVSGDDMDYPAALQGHKSYATLAQVNLPGINSETLQNWSALGKPFMKRFSYKTGLNTVNSTAVRKRTVFQPLDDDFYFHKHRKIEEEVEKIKKIVVETKEVVLGKSASNDFSKEMELTVKRHLDVNRISDQVYQNIERRIRMERERRGL